MSVDDLGGGLLQDGVPCCPWMRSMAGDKSVIL
jgi:hypothetical protein